ncbi:MULTISPECIES: hypothetical protein [Pseudomonas]|uniref:hypothetical protein n=1 Tax=Pseudomonas TaxID=286 RepID=UPI00156D4311|nr:MULTISPECIES: hypothetical protein [Pseudomonas]
MNMQVKSGGVLALPPTIVGVLPDGRIPYQQLKVDRRVIIYDAHTNDDISDPPLEFKVDLTAPYQRQPGTGNGTGPRPALISQTGLPTRIDDAWLADPANAGGLDLPIPTGYPCRRQDRVGVGGRHQRAELSDRGQHRSA